MLTAAASRTCPRRLTLAMLLIVRETVTRRQLATSKCLLRTRRNAEKARLGRLNGGWLSRRIESYSVANGSADRKQSAAPSNGGSGALAVAGDGRVDAHRPAWPVGVRGSGSPCGQTAGFRPPPWRCKTPSRPAPSSDFASSPSLIFGEAAADRSPQPLGHPFQQPLAKHAGARRASSAA